MFSLILHMLHHVLLFESIHVLPSQDIMTVALAISYYFDSVYILFLTIPKLVFAQIIWEK